MEQYCQKFIEVYQLFLADELKLCAEWRINGVFAAAKFWLVKSDNLPEKIVSSGTFDFERPIFVGVPFGRPVVTYCTDCFINANHASPEFWSIDAAIVDANAEISVLQSH